MSIRTDQSERFYYDCSEMTSISGSLVCRNEFMTRKLPYSAKISCYSLFSLAETTSIFSEYIFIHNLLFYKYTMIKSIESKYEMFSRLEERIMFNLKCVFTFVKLKKKNNNMSVSSFRFVVTESLKRLLHFDLLAPLHITV